MKKILLFSLFLLIAAHASGQEGITFQVEKLSPAEKLLSEYDTDELLKKLINEDSDISWYEDVEGLYGIVARSEMPDSLANYGFHSFFRGMFSAYADHRPFVLSPDMIWLLISQGFAQHINSNPGKYRDLFVDFDGRKQLVVYSDDVSLDSPPERWESIFPKFMDQIARHTRGNLVEILTADFSTTTSVERIASQITIMEAMEPYFEYVHFYAVCGIPEITLLGTSEDWVKVLEKTRQLSRYDLGWWTSKLEPLLEEFIKASQGNICKKFWMDMFKYHRKNRYGAPYKIDGWIVKFFPYDSYGNRNNLREIVYGVGGAKLPDEIVKVDLKHIQIDDMGQQNEVMLELWAGFMGLEQCCENYALTPKIGWMIRMKDVENAGLQHSLSSHSEFGWPVRIKVTEIPEALLKMDQINSLEIDFTDRIIIPDEIGNVIIGELTLSGKITPEEIKRIKRLLPRTALTINGRAI